MSSLGTSFSTQGATPFGPLGAQQTQTSTPATRTGPGLFQQLGLGSANNNLPIVNGPSTPLKSTVITDASGNTIQHNYHAPEVGTNKGLISSSSSSSTPSPTPSPGTAAPSTSSTNPTATYPGIVNSLANTGGSSYNQQTSNSINGLNNSGVVNGQLGQNAQDIANNAGKQIADIGKETAGTAGGYLTGGLIAPQALGGAAVQQQTGAAQKEAVAAGANMALQGNSQALTAQGQTQSGQTNAGNLANTGQANTQSALGTAGTLASPLGSTPYALDPLTGKVIGGGGNAQDALIGAGNLNTVSDFTQKYNAGKAQLSAADGIQNQIISTLKTNPTLNSTPVSAITNLNELLSGQVSNGPQQLLSQQIASYINTLGLDPASVANIAHQQTGTLGQLLDSLRQTAETKNEAFNPKNVNTAGQSNNQSGSQSSSGGTSSVQFNTDGTLQSVKF